MIQSTKFCPVPREQQPVNEYRELTESWFFQWATLPTVQFRQKLATIWLFSLIITAPISASSFAPSKATFSFILASCLGSAFFVGLALIRLYLGWYYVGNRLKTKIIPYEESSWYDGQIWEKSSEDYQRDQLIFIYQIKPILQKLGKSVLILLILVIISSLIFFLF